MAKVNLSEFKSHFSDYARRVKEGETVILCERNVPIAEIRPIVKTVLERRAGPGRFREPISFGDAFFDADAELARDFSFDAAPHRLEACLPCPPPKTSTPSPTCGTGPRPPVAWPTPPGSP